MKSIQLQTICLTLLLTSVGAFAEETDLIEKTFTAQPGGTLVMAVDRGNLNIIRSKTGSVEIRVERELKRGSAASAREVFQEHQIDFDQSGNTVNITAENPQKNRFFKRNPFNELRVTYTAAVPEKFNLDLRTSGGNIQISQLQGQVVARTAGGNIKLEGLRGDAELRTAGGNIHTGNSEGKVVARTSGGNIRIDSASGAVDAHTSGGNVEIKEASGPVKLQTSGGHVSALLNQQPESDCVLKTSGGNVAITLAQGIGMDVDAHTSGGRIRSDFNGELNKQRTKFSGEINGGGPNLTLSTSGGNVDIRQK